MLFCCCQTDDKSAQVVTANMDGFSKPGEADPAFPQLVRQREHEEYYSSTTGSSDSLATSYSSEVFQLAEPTLDGSGVSAESLEEMEEDRFGMRISSKQASKPGIGDETPPPPVAPTLPGANLEQKARTDKSKAHTEYVVHITMDSKVPLGIEIRDMEEKMLIMGLRDGPVKAWNQTHEDDLAVRVGDRVMSVNGVSGNFTVLQACLERADGVVDIRLRRPREWRVFIDKKSNKELGAGLRSRIKDEFMMPMVMGVRSGPLQDWNNMNPGHEVSWGDRLKCVNGISDDVEKMVANLKKSNQLELVVMRAP